MKVLVKIVETKVKTLCSGDKSMRFTCELLIPEDIPNVNEVLSSKTETEIEIPDN